MSLTSVENLNVVSEAEWLVARQALLLKEKELTRARDRLNEERRKLPWVRVEKNYVFDTVDGKKTLAELFATNSQLIIYHFMWRHDLDEGCIGCSFFSDHIDGANLHLAHHDVSFVVVSRAPLWILQAFKERMGWKFSWVSSYNSDFNFDYHVSFTPEELAIGQVYYNYEMTKASIDELPGTSVFFKNDAGEIFHTYSAYARGDESGIGAYMLLDLTPKGRNENGPDSDMTDWIRHHDRYDSKSSTTSATNLVASAEDRRCCSALERNS